jgi:hypothetical protein
LLDDFATRMTESVPAQEDVQGRPVCEPLLLGEHQAEGQGLCSKLADLIRREVDLSQDDITSEDTLPAERP